MPDPISPHAFGDILSTYPIHYARRVGKVTLILGTGLVADEFINDDEIIMLTAQPGGSLLGVVRVFEIDTETSFTIRSTNLTDNAVIGYAIF